MPNKKGPYKMDYKVPAEKLDYIQSSSAPSRMNSYDKDMMHERELISDAKKEIHKEDVAKKKHMHIVSRIAGRNSK